jgi:CRISPR-associated protein Cst1
LNILKKGGDSMDESVDKNNKRLWFLYNEGIQIHEILKSKNEDNKLNGYTYKMLNSIKAGNKQEFMDIVIRLHMFMDRDVSPIFLDVMKDTDLDFSSIGHSFISGLISNKYEGKN